MSYVIWLHIENEDEADSAPQKAWWVLDRQDTLALALIQAAELVDELRATLGIESERLDDDTEDDLEEEDDAER